MTYKFAALAAHLDHVEAVAGRRPGGASADDDVAIYAAEATAARASARTGADIAWKLRRLARAFENGWRRSLILAWAWSVLRDFPRAVGRPGGGGAQ